MTSLFNVYPFIIAIWSLICYGIGMWLGKKSAEKRFHKLLGKYHELDESRTWFWDDDIVKALGGERWIRF